MPIELQVDLYTNPIKLSNRIVYNPLLSYVNAMILKGLTFNGPIGVVFERKVSPRKRRDRMRPLIMHF